MLAIAGLVTTYGRLDMGVVDLSVLGINGGGGR